MIRPLITVLPLILFAAACATSDNTASTFSAAPTAASRPPPAPSPLAPPPPVIAPPPPQMGEPAKPVRGATEPKAVAPVAAATPKAAAPKAGEPKNEAPKESNKEPEKVATLDLKTLEQRLKSTPAIGVMTKLSLKNQVDDLVGRFRSYHAGKRPPALPELKPSYELLVMKVMTLLQDKDAALAKDINASRNAIWALLIDRDKLAAYA